MKLFRLSLLLGMCVALVWLFVQSCGDTFVVAPDTISVTLTSDPVTGEAPLLNVDLTARTSGSATGPITYRYECLNNGSVDLEFTTDEETHTAVDVCGYTEPGTYIAKVAVERGLTSASSLTIITVESPPPSSSTSDTVTVAMKDNFFSPREVTVKPGATIVWPNVGARPHTSTSDDGIWDSGTIAPNDSFSWVVPEDSTTGTSLPYFCVFHGAQGGIGMAGIIHVDSAPPTETTLTVSLNADPLGGEAPLQGVDLSAQVSGTATGPITYRFDCTNDAVFEHELTTDADFYTAVDVCTYDSAGTYTAKVVAQREGLTAEATASITVDEPPPPSGGDEVTVSMKDNFFSPREVTVKPGTKINWPNVGARPHTSTSDNGIWDSGTIAPNDSFSWIVPEDTQSGASLPYFCVFHGAQGGIGMAGIIHVDS
ncbi:MAG: hypothetical protein ACE5IR_24685, partial [bacterium]